MHASVEISLFLWCSVSFLVSEGTAPLFPQPPEALEAGRKAALARHNVLRCMHGAPPLTLDETANGIAQKYAEKIAAEEKFKHSHTKGYGENLFASSARGSITNLPPEVNVTSGMIRATNSFYREEQFYKPVPGQTKVFADPDPKHETGHFTALVWKATKMVGIGAAISQEPASQKDKVWTKITVVANYAPPGNMYDPESYAKNVEPCPSKTEAECGGVEDDYKRVEKNKFCEKLYWKRGGGGGSSKGRGGTEEAGGAEAVALSTFLGLLSLLMSLKAVFYIDEPSTASVYT